MIITKQNMFILPIEAVLLVICAIYTFFTMKSRMLQDIYEIGVRRELRSKKKKHYRQICLKKLYDYYSYNDARLYYF